MTAFAAMMGILTENIPNKSHNKVPNAKSEYIDKDMPVVFFVCIVFIACGRKDMVVQTAAARPKIVMMSNLIF